MSLYEKIKKSKGGMTQEKNGKLTDHARALSPKAGPDGSFPIPDEKHARLAVAMAARKGGSVESEVDRKVHARFPDIDIQHDAKGGPVIAVVHPALKPAAVAAPLSSSHLALPASALGAARILAALKAKKMSEGGLDDDAPPMYEAFQSTNAHMADGGSVCSYCNGGGCKMCHGGKMAQGGMVGPQEDEDPDFLSLDDVFPDESEFDGMDNEIDPASDEEGDDETGEGDNRSILRHIMSTLRARHAAR